MKSHEGRSVFLSEAHIEEMVQAGAWDNKILIDHFDFWAKKQPDQIAVTSYLAEPDTSTSLSFSELKNVSERIAANMLELGIGLGDIVSFQLNNRWEFYAISIACVRIGAVTNPLMPVLREKELSFMLAMTESKILIVPKEFRRFDFKSMALGLQGELPSLEHVFVIDDDDPEIGFGRLLADTPLPKSVTPPNANEITQLLFTSGTTGEPKGVMHTANTLFSNVLQLAERLKITKDDVIFCPTPLAHQLGALFGFLLPALVGAKVVFQDIWDPDKAVDMIAEAGATLCMGATPFLADLAANTNVAERDFSKFRQFISGGAPIPPALVRRAKKNLKAEIISVWGMTEVLVVTTVKPGDPEEKAFNSDGVPILHSAVRVVDENNKELPPGVEGRLEASGASICVGYIKRPELYIVNDDIWFDTGDLARIDDEGYIRITGRSKDIIIRGGENIPVVEIESALYRHDAINQVAIVAMPDERLGERSCAFATLKEGQSFSLSEMSDFLTEQRISRVYHPERLEILDEMPMTATGKIQKFELRDQAQKLRVE